MKLTACILLVGAFAAVGATEEQINKQFDAQPGGRVVVDINFGSITVNTNSKNQVTVDVWRKITRKSKQDEEAFLREAPVEITQDGTTVTVRCRAKFRQSFSWFGRNQNEAKYTITVPSQFNAQLSTAGGGIAVHDLNGQLNAHTSGGGLEFARVRGPVEGATSGGGIKMSDCEGNLKINTSGGGIDVHGGSGNLSGETSGGSIVVKDFHGPARVHTSGGSVMMENIAGVVDGSTSGGSIHARIPQPVPESIRLETSGGSITVYLPGDATVDLDAATSAGGVSSDLPVTMTVAKPERSVLRGTINGGGKSVWLRTSGGSIHVKKQ